jgi:preprotein translocase SecE subunit
MSDRRVLGFAWLFLALLVWLVLRDFFQWSFATFDIPNQRYLGSFQASSLLGVAVSGIAGAITWKHKTIYDFCIETVSETRQVVWPGKDETRENTVIVVVVSVIMSLVLGAFDLVWAKLSNFILSAG